MPCYICEDQRNTPGSWFSSSIICVGDWTQVTRLGGQSLYSLSHFPGWEPLKALSFMPTSLRIALAYYFFNLCVCSYV